MATDIATIDWTGLVVALFACVGVIGNYIRTSGRTKYLTAIGDILDTLIDLVTYCQMLMCSMNGQACDQVAFKAKGDEILKQITQIKADLAL